MSTSDAFISLSRCPMSKPPRGNGRYGTPATLHSNTSFSYSFRLDATLGHSLLRRFIVSSVQMCAWASIDSGFGIAFPPQRHGRACCLVQGHDRQLFGDITDTSFVGQVDICDLVGSE